MARERLHVMQAREDEARKSSARAGYSGSALKQPASRKVSTSGGQGSLASSMDLAIVEQIIPPGSIKVSWDSVVGLESAKQVLLESVIVPLQRPDLFTGLRAPVKGRGACFIFRSSAVWPAWNRQDLPGQGGGLRSQMHLYFGLGCHADVKVCRRKRENGQVAL